MKTTLLILALITAIVLTGCASYSYEEATIDATVTKCVEGTFFPDEEYLAQANICLAFDKLEMYTYYMGLANANGKYDYKITLSYNGVETVVTRPDKYELGSIITINAQLEYADGILVRIICE